MKRCAGFVYGHERPLRQQRLEEQLALATGYGTLWESVDSKIPASALPALIFSVPSMAGLLGVWRTQRLGNSAFVTLTQSQITKVVGFSQSIARVTRVPCRRCRRA